MSDEERKVIGKIPNRKTKQTRAKVQALFDKATANLIEGRRWDHDA